MAKMNRQRRFQVVSVMAFGLLGFVAVAAGGAGSVKPATDSQLPAADAGSSRYAAEAPLQLDGTDSHDPVDSGPLGYAWRQIAGPSVVITDADTATPTISGFVQTHETQECKFELVVSDGELTSLPDTVKVIIVPDFGASTLQQENPPFDADKPTVIYFGGGDCRIGLSGQGWNASAWNTRANVISFPNGYGPDSGGGARTYYKYGDMIIVYLSSMAPDYKQPIQTIGWSTGGDPAIDVGIHLNQVYTDARYAVNRVTHLDAGCRVMAEYDGSWGLYTQIAESFLSTSVDGEQCWIEHYYGTKGYGYEPFPLRDFLLASLGLSHSNVRDWYRNSLIGNDMNNFNSGVVAGAYWSVIGPGKNLQLASQTDAYYFRWDGNTQDGKMSFFSETQYPGRLPEPVRLFVWRDPWLADDDPNAILLTCQESENAVGYQFLSGSDPYHVADYNIVADSNRPPAVTAAMLPSSDTWWTVKARDTFGSTIYADPMPVDSQAGPDTALIALVDFNGDSRVDLADFSRLAQYWRQHEPSIDIVPAANGDPIVDVKELTILAECWLKELQDPTLIAHWKLDETEGFVARDSIGDCNGTVLSANPLWRPADGMVNGALELDGIDDSVSVPFVLNPADGDFSVFAWIKGGAPGQVIIAQTQGGATWLLADPIEGKLMTELKGVGRFSGPLYTEMVVTDGQWRRVGLTWDGSNRVLYVDDVEAARDTQSSLASSEAGLYIGAGKDREPGSFFSGLIDDVRIYERAVAP
jgi:hypothetical protein